MEGHNPMMLEQVASALEAMLEGVGPGTLQVPEGADSSTERAFRAVNTFAEEIAALRRCAQSAHKHESNVADMHRKLGTLFNTIPGFTISIDRNYAITDINETMVQAYGLEEHHSLLGRSCYEVLWNRSSICSHCIVEDVYRTGESAERYSTQEEEDRAGRTYKFYANPIRDDSGGIVGAVEIALDITDMQKVQEELRAARDEAQVANRVKSEFLANMSHEIRTPMNGILGMTELVLLSNLDAEQRDYLETAQQSAKTLMKIIDDILLLSKLEAERLELDTLPFTMNWLLGSVCDSFKEQAADRGNSLTYTIDPEVPEMVQGDPFRLCQVLSGIVSNAVKFTENGVVDVEVRSFELPEGYERDDNSRGSEMVHLLFMVRDDGVGILPEKAAGIFERFSQVDGSFTRRYGGAGLSLTIAHRLLKCMGGHIWVDSAKNIGSTFCFTVHLSAVPQDVADCERDMG